MGNGRKYKLTVDIGSEIHLKAFYRGLEKTVVLVSLCKR